MTRCLFLTNWGITVNEHISRIVNHPLRVPVSVGATSFAVGVGVGYFLSQRQGRRAIELHHVPTMDLDLKISELAEIERQELMDHHPTAKERADLRIVIPEDAFKKLVIDEQPEESYIHDYTTPIAPNEVVDTVVQPPEEIVQSETPVGDVISETTEPAVVSRSIFADNVNEDDTWDFTEEVKSRTPDRPYIVHKDEFYSDEMNFTQTTLTYYAGDDIMCDQDDSPIYNYETVTGPLRFGHGSGDRNIVYVRNERRKAEYEIIFDPGMYSVEVLGLEIENNERVRDVRNSPPKFRME